MPSRAATKRVAPSCARKVPGGHAEALGDPTLPGCPSNCEERLQLLLEDAGPSPPVPSCCPQSLSSSGTQVTTPRGLNQGDEFASASRHLPFWKNTRQHNSSSSGFSLMVIEPALWASFLALRCARSLAPRAFALRGVAFSGSLRGSRLLSQAFPKVGPLQVAVCAPPWPAMFLFTIFTESLVPK